MQHYAITLYGTTKAAPFAVVRFDRGVFEEYRAGRWRRTDRYAGILTGDFVDYEPVTADEAEAITKAR